MRTSAAALAAVSLVCSAVQAQSASPAEALIARERAVVEASGRDGFAAAIGAALAPDGALLWGGAPVVHGAGPVKALLAAQRPLDSLRLSWQPLGVEAAKDGSLGITWGLIAIGRDGTAPRFGRYIAAWRPDGGSWVLAALVAIGIYPPAQTVQPDGPVTLPAQPAAGPAASFIAADLAFAKLAGEQGASVAFSRYAAPDAITMGPVLNRGPKAIGEAFEGGPPTKWSWHPVLAGASTGGDLGWTIGEAIIAPEGSAPAYTKYLTIWRKEPGGAVRYLIDGGNARPATP